jgi:transcriptional regulator with XRE-family HTH domain
MPQEDVTAARIKQLRKQASLTQAQLATKVGLSRAAISQFEAGDSKPSVGTLVRLADALGINLNDLVSGTYQEDRSALKKTDSVQTPGFLLAVVVVDLPFIPLNVRSSLTEGEGTVPRLDSFDTIRLHVSTEEEAANYTDAIVIEVGEDNMEPLLHAGDKIIAWPVPQSEWDQIYNQVCVVAYKDIVTIKAVRENELLTRDLLTLHAQNSVAGFLPVQRQQIKAIWRVEEFFDRPKIRL